MLSCPARPIPFKNDYCVTLLIDCLVKSLKLTLGTQNWPMHSMFQGVGLISSLTWYNTIPLKAPSVVHKVSSSAMATSRRDRNWHPTMNCLVSTSGQILPTPEDDGIGPTAGGLPTVFRVPIRNWIVADTTHTRQQWIFATWDTWNSVYCGTSRHGCYYAWCWYLSDFEGKSFRFRFWFPRSKLCLQCQANDLGGTLKCNKRQRTLIGLQWVFTFDKEKKRNLVLTTGLACNCISRTV